MKALDAYRGVLRELDKFGSPTFTIKDFNYFFNSTIDEYVSNNYDEFDIKAKDLMDLEKLYIVGSSLSFSSGIADFPSAGRFPARVVIEQVLSRNEGPYAINETVTAVPKRMRSNQIGLNNAFKTPSLLYPRYIIAAGKIILYTVDFVNVSSGTLDYIKNPSTVYLADEGADYNQEVNNTTIEFPDYVTREIIKQCRRIFIDNIESPRYQAQLAEQQLRKE